MKKTGWMLRREINKISFILIFKLKFIHHIFSYLTRTLQQKVNTIAELENKLTELSKVRREENENFSKKMAEWENKYKMMHDNLSSEIKLLTGKLNSMEEFRLQRDDLMAKFDTQEQEIKEQAKKHKAILYEMERKVILDKERMRKDVENKLLELSTEFTKTSDLRVAASTQRLVRENIALNNDMDRMMFSLDRLQKENEEMKKKHKEIASQYEVSVAEKKRLIKTAEQQLTVINKLTHEYENQKDLSDYLIEIKRSHEVARKMTRDNRNEMSDYREKNRLLEQKIHQIDCDREQLKVEALFHRGEAERVANIIKQVRSTVKSAVCGEKFQDDPSYQELQRRNLLTDLLNILNDLDKQKRKPSMEAVSSVTDFYMQGDLGIIPKDEVDEIVEKMPKMKIKVEKSAKTIDDAIKEMIEEQSELLEAIGDGSSAPDEDDEDDEVLKIVRKTSMSIDLRKSMEGEVGENVEQQPEEEIEEEEEICETHEKVVE